MLHRLQFTAIAATFLAFSARAFGQTYQVVTVSNGGAITGTVKWSGTMPTQPSLAITKDQQICDPTAHKTRDLERIVVGPEGGVANTVVYSKDISQGKAVDLPPQRRFLD